MSISYLPTGTQYRITRPDLYDSNCPGRTNPSGRQGYYVYGESIENALNTMRKRFPNENYDVQVWDNGDEHGKLLGRYR